VIKKENLLAGKRMTYISAFIKRLYFIKPIFSIKGNLYED